MGIELVILLASCDLKWQTKDEDSHLKAEKSHCIGVSHNGSWLFLKGQSALWSLYMWALRAVSLKYVLGYSGTPHWYMWLALLLYSLMCWINLSTVSKTLPCVLNLQWNIFRKESNVTVADHASVQTTMTLITRQRNRSHNNVTMACPSYNNLSLRRWPG